MAPYKNIFCVEDEGNVAHLLKNQLDMLGYSVCGMADNAATAIAGIQNSNPDLVLVDIELKGRPEGFEIGDYLISKTDIPFIYVTCHDEKKVLAKARQTIPDGYLLKPYDLRQLKVAIEMAHRMD